ncbi:MAG: hydroxysqualene dehydroxylase HpnE, partial [Acidimicrobiales bacterium]
MSTSPPRVAVIGGGLAGITAALDCAEAGAQVTLLERRSHLGGLTWSFRHHGAAGGRWVDNGQHVFLRCCSAYLGFLARIGSSSDVVLQDRLDMTVLGDSASARLRRDDLPAPLHLGRSLLGYRHLGIGDRLRIGLAALPLHYVDLSDPALDRETFASWLGRHGQRPSSMAALWDLIVVPTVNLPSDQASAAMGAKVFQTGLLRDAKAADIGWSGIPLGTLHGERSAKALESAGVDVRLAERVVSLQEAPVEEDGGGGKGPRPPWLIRAEASELVADAVVVALPPGPAGEVLPPDSYPRQARLDELGSSPIVDVHVVFERKVTDWTFVAFLGKTAQWVFDRTASAGIGDGQQYLAVSISSAAAQLGRHPDEISEEVVGELREKFPAARQVGVVDTLVTKERNATVALGPGTAALRPHARSTRPGLALAGAWT